MKIIFLDIDGVLNSEEFFKEERKKWEDGLRDNKRYLQEEFSIPMLENLKRIVDETGAEIVLSSSWRISKDDRDMVVKNFDRVGLKHFIDWTPQDLRSNFKRGNEIQKWLDDNKDKYDIENFIILDDESDMVHLKSKLVKTTWSSGLTSELANKAIQALNR